MRRGGMVFTDIVEIQSALERLTEKLAAQGICISPRRRLPYGCQVELERSGEKGLIDIYYSAKKGLSFIDSSHNALARDAISTFTGGAQSPAARPYGAGKAENELETWIGTDESGKGDFFGPLVVAGFYTDRAHAQELIAMGVRDSKMLDSARIRSIASALRRRFGRSINVVAPSNRSYNDLYGSMRNLNRMLAWAHARVIENIISGEDGCGGMAVDGVVTDRFGDESYIYNGLKSMKTLNLIQRPRAESNPAVAAASIIARDCFERRIQELEAKFGLTLPLGAQRHVTDAARRFIGMHGREKLVEVAKLHFKNYKEI